jgi:hypothetical protein
MLGFVTTWVLTWGGFWSFNAAAWGRSSFNFSRAVFSDYPTSINKANNSILHRHLFLFIYKMFGSSAPSVPPVSSLDRPEPLHQTLARDRPEDCTPCRVTGAAAFVGLGAYSYWSGHKQLKEQQAKIMKSGSMFGMRSRQMGITGIAMSLVCVGLYRLVN